MSRQGGCLLVQEVSDVSGYFDLIKGGLMHARHAPGKAVPV